MSFTLPYKCSLCNTRSEKRAVLFVCDQPNYRICSKCISSLDACESWEQKRDAVNQAYAEHGNMLFKCSNCKIDLDQPGFDLPSNDPDYLICRICDYWIDAFGGIKEKQAAVNEAYAARCAEQTRGQ